jgi:metal-responsive CopG/Arc/MetJ family transcriptional regulator
MAKTKITISIDEGYVRKLDRIARLKHSNRSNLIEEAIRAWESEHIQAALTYGYQTMAKEDRKAAEEYIKIAQEILHE